MKNRKLLLICCLMAASCLSSCDDTTTEKLNWHQGLTMPSSNISAVEGDFYFDVDDGIIYSYKNNSWKVVLTLGGGNGNANKSAYEVYKTIFADYDKSELEWSKELVEGTLKAPKTYTVTFDSQNGTYSFTKIVTENKKVEKPEDPKKGNQEFLGWFTEEGTEWIFGGNNVDANIKLIAKWGQEKENEDTSSPSDSSSPSGSTTPSGSPSDSSSPSGSTTPSGSPSDSSSPSGSTTPSGSPSDSSSPTVNPTYETITIARAIELTKQLPQGGKSTESYYIKGNVTEIWNATYGNFNFGPQDNQFTVYGSYSSDGSVAYADMAAKVAVNDEIVFYGKLYHFYNASSKVPTKYEVENAWIMSINGVAVNADGTLAGSSSGGNTGGNTGGNDDDYTPINPGTQWTNSDFGSYYQGIDFSNNSSLLSQLQSLNSQKRKSTVGYKNMPDKFKYTDYDPNSTISYDSKGQPYSTKIVGFYTDDSASYSGNMNREHVWPNSRGGEAVENDIHMTRPTFTKDNSSRGNSFYVANMASSSAGWDPKTAGMLESSRGYAARIVFYCVVANSGFKLVDLSNDSTGNNSMGKLSDLLKWNLQYAVDVTELNRNNGAQYLQGNRNPFIDNPYLACAIWGNTNETTRQICKDYGVIVDPYTGDITLPDGSNPSSPSVTPSSPSSPSTTPSVQPSSPSTSPSTQPSTPSTGGYYQLVTSTTDLVAGGKYVMASSNGFVAGAISGKYLSSISCTINDNKITNLPSNALVITLGGNTDAWTLDTGNGLIGATSVKNLAIDSGTTTWKISFENNNAIIYNTNESYGRFLYNVDSPRFLVYTSNTSDKMLLVQLYKYVD